MVIKRATKRTEEAEEREIGRPEAKQPHSQLAGWTPQRPRVSVIIPALNEEKNIPYVLSRLPDRLWEVIVVDGRSVDRTIEVAKLHCDRIRVVRQFGRGKGDALREGFRHFTGDVVVALDGDGSMDPAEIDRFVSPLENGCDFVKGSRTLAEGGSEDFTMLRRLGNWGFRTLTNILAGTSYTDLCYGYFAFRRGTVDALDLRSDGFEIETEIAIKASLSSLRITEVPSYESARLHGVSNLHSFRDGWRILKTIISSIRIGRSSSARDDIVGAPVRSEDPE